MLALWLGFGIGLGMPGIIVRVRVCKVLESGQSSGYDQDQGRVTVRNNINQNSNHQS